MRYRILFLVVLVWLFFCTLAHADIPRTMNFQGRLTDASGKFVADGNYSLTFRIYSDSTGGSSKWSETQSVAVSKGLFNVILGTLAPIPDSIFSYANTWLGIQVGADPEMTPRQRLSSLGYAYRGAKSDTSSYSMNSDRLDGFHASDFSSIGTDYGRSGVATDLYEGTTTLTDKYVNAAGPDSVLASSNTAFSGKAAGSDAGRKCGISGYADNSSTGGAWGGYFSTSSNGTGDNVGVIGNASISTSNTSTGVQGSAQNTSSGLAYGGYFSALNLGTGTHYGVYSLAGGGSSNPSYGCYGYAVNTSTSSALGTSGLGSNTSTGIAIGSHGRGDNSSTGDAYGGFFEVWSSGTGKHYGSLSQSYGSSSNPSYGVYGYGSNSSTGDAYGAYFETSSSGTGTHYGLRAKGQGSSYYTTYGVYAQALNNSTGDTYAGEFYANSSGTAGSGVGVAAEAHVNSAATACGINAYAANSSSGSALAGYFYASSSSGAQYGVYSSAPTSGYAGYFYGNMTATGTKSAAVKVNNGEYRHLYCQESPENWFEDFGEGQLQNGKVHIELDPMFLQTVAINSQNPMKVFIQLNDENCKGTAVKRGTTGFDVVELQNGTSNATFSYRVVAKRKGYEDLRLAKMIGPTPEEVQAEQSKQHGEMEKQKAQREEERLTQEQERKQLSEQQVKIGQEMR